MLTRATSLILILAFSAVANAQMYRWVDEKGKTHFSDAPPPGTKGVQKSAAPKSAASKPAEPFALQNARASNPVTLYTATDCGPGCTEARDYLNKRGVPFSEISISDSAKLEELKKVSGGNGVPVMLVGKTVHKGFEVGIYEAALDSAGYPRTGILPPRNSPPPAPAVNTEKAAEPAKAEEPRPRGPYSPR